MRKKKFFIFGVLAVLLVSALLIFTGCPSSESLGHIAKYLWMTDTSNGGVYTYDFSTHEASATAFVSTGQNATGAIYFYDDIGYICVGSYNNTAPGLYRFDPNSTSPTLEHYTNSSSLSAQYLAYISSTKAYLTDYNNGVYEFDPSNIDSKFTLITGTDGSAQDIKLINTFLYTASYGNNSILKINPISNEVYTLTLKDSSGNDLLIHPSYLTANPDSTKIYFTNTGSYDANWNYNNDGSIYELDLSTNQFTAIQTDMSFGPTAIAINGNYLYIGGYSNTYYIDLTSSSKDLIELKGKDGNSFGSASILIHDGLIYFSGGYGNNYIKIFDASTNKEVDYSPVYVGDQSNPDGIGITGLDAY